MARRSGFLAFVPFMLIAATAGADEGQAAPAPQTFSDKIHARMTQLKPVSTYAGVGLFDDMMNVNVETVTDLGNFYLRLGKFIEADAGIAANAGWRYPITGGRDESGYFMGVFIGHVAAETYEYKEYNRGGIGADLGYHWVGEHTRKVFSVGLGTGFSKQVENRPHRPAAPTVYFSFSTALKVL